MGVEKGQGGQWTPRGAPKVAQEGSQRPNWEPQGAQMVGQGIQMVGQGSLRGPTGNPREPKWWAKGFKWWAKGPKSSAKAPKRVAKGSHKTAKMEPKTTYERKCEHIKNIEKPKENLGFLRILGVWAPPERPQRPSKIKVWRLRGPKSDRSRA